MQHEVKSVYWSPLNELSWFKNKKQCQIYCMDQPIPNNPYNTGELIFFMGRVYIHSFVKHKIHLGQTLTLFHNVCSFFQFSYLPVRFSYLLHSTDSSGKIPSSSGYYLLYTTFFFFTSFLCYSFHTDYTHEEGCRMVWLKYNGNNKSNTKKDISHPNDSQKENHSPHKIIERCKEFFTYQ